MNRADALQLSYRVIVAGFEGDLGAQAIRSTLRDKGLGGVIFFRRNIESAAALKETIDDFQSTTAKDNTPLFCVDQEGGRVVRLRAPLTVLPPARELAALNDPTLSHQAGLLVGKELAACGLNLNFAPVLDVDTRPVSPIIGDRSFGPNPSVVIEHGLAFARGLESGGVRACAKHFPGHGDATCDSHLELPRIELPRHRLESTEMVPFGAWVGAGFQAVMTAHIIYQALDPDSIATQSAPIVTGLLRKSLGFDGVVFTDDLEMNAVGLWASPKDVAIAAIRAGVDGLLVCKHIDLWQEIAEALASEAMSDSLFAAKLTESGARIQKLASFAKPKVDVNWLDSEDHRRLRDLILERL